jgi:hypothetical protein
MPPPKEDAPRFLGSDEVVLGVVEALGYIKKSFEDASLLDDLPLSAAGNPGAWHAWQAYRKKIKTAGEAPTAGIGTPQRRLLGGGGRPRASGEWSWDGVWQDRVRKGVVASVSEGVLFGESDELVSDMFYFVVRPMLSSDGSNQK